MSHAMEQKAQRLWTEAGPDPSKVSEVVAIGFEDPIDETITWWELPNSAGVGEFFVEVEDLEIALTAAKLSGLCDPSGLVYLWHSHYVSDMPSASDMSNFPSWLVDAGIVYHAPSGTTRVYNGEGVLSEDGGILGNTAEVVTRSTTSEVSNA